jgi:hypothetical protein
VDGYVQRAATASRQGINQTRGCPRNEGATAMTELVLKLPDELAQRAKSAGLLTDSAIQRLLEEAMRREAGRKLLAVAKHVHAAGVERMSDDEIVAEVKAARAQRKARA